MGTILRWPAGKVVRRAVAALGLVTVGAATAGAQVSLTPLDPVFVQTLRSLNAATPTSVQFVNAAASPVRVLWIDYSGMEVFYNFLAPGQSYVQPTYVTHPWLIRNADTGAPVVGFLPVAEPGIATIQPFAAVPEPSTVALTALGLATMTAGAIRRRAGERRA